MRVSQGSPQPSKRQRTPQTAHPPVTAQDETKPERSADAAVMPPSQVPPPPVVGIGGSTGAIAALQSFFSKMPADSGMAFVVVMHFSPEHESGLAASLQHVTPMPVVQVKATTPIEVNHVYVIPPARHLSVSKGHLYLSTMERPLDRRVAVDLLFRSLADHHGPRATAVVLSGFDGDGSIGIKRVKERGGLTVAQDPREAEQDGMPRTAIATRMVDLVLPVAEIPGRLIEYYRRESRVRLPAEHAPTARRQADEDIREKALSDVLASLRVSLGHDFSCYKRATVLRRAGRRMQVNGIDEMTAYREFLRSHPGEAGALQQDLLIPVTDFFRDPEAFAALANEMPRLFQDKQATDTIRVWVAGCATGEEAYSVAMLLREHADTLEHPPKLQVFATDLDENAINTARAGIYPETIVADVTPERLQRFFTRDTRGYRVQGALRETVLFAVHDLLEDPPFSRLDLAICRNLLIDLHRAARSRAFDVFHYALHGQGPLMLGTTESAADAPRLFEPLDGKQGLYLRNKFAGRALMGFYEKKRSVKGLDTGREELQSMNEELTTVNQELKSKVEELARANGDLANLMASTNIATVFLDRGLCIQRYTPSAVGLFNLIPADAGRPFSDLTRRLDYPDLIADAARTLEQLSQSEREVPGPGGGWWLARMQPYRTPSDQVAGVVMTFINITKRKKAERDLHHSETAFRQLADAMPLIVWTARPDGEADYYSQPWYDFTGFPPGSVGNVQWPEVVHPDDIALLGVRWADALAHGQPFGHEFRLRRGADGAYRWFLVRALPIRNGDGEIIRWLGTSTDISEHKAAEEATRATAERLHLAMNAARLGTWEWNIQTDAIQWSPEHNSTHDSPRQQRQGSFEEGMRHIHPDDRQRVIDQLRAAIAERRDAVMEMRSVHRDGSTHWIAASGRAIYDEAGAPLRMIGVVQDITVRKQAEAALRQSEERFRLANIHSPFPVMLHADDGEVLQINDAWTHKTGYTPEELSTVSHWIERAYPAREAQDRAWQFLEQLPEHLGAIESKGRCIRCADGTTRIWDISHANLDRLPDGRCLRITTAIDVTEQHADEVALRLAKEEAENANAAKSEFLSRMSHELRTPLNAILGFGQILEMSALETQDAKCVGLILKGGKHLLGLIDEVLDIARVEAGELALKPVAVAVDRLLRECIGFVAKMAEARGVTCAVNLRRDRQVPVWADEQRFRQVLLNLLGNAIKYNRPGGQVTVSCKRTPGGRMRVSIQDTGLGIAAENVARLFVPFERLGQETGDVEGTGLGLVVSQKLVEAMGGTLGVESEVCRGSTFWVELPTAPEAAADEREARAKAGPAFVEAAPALAESFPATLLYVEDNVSNLQVLKTVVERLRPHWRFLSATDGTSGLALVREQLPDLVLLDVQLPGLRGDAVLSELRADTATARLPVLMLSADATAHSRERLLALGATDYASKPFNVHDLLEKLDRILLGAREGR